jgi:hypothetical protein
MWEIRYVVRYQKLALNYIAVKFRAFWDVARCAYCLHHQGDNLIALMMEAVGTWSYIPEDSKLDTRHCENLKSHILLWHVTLNHTNRIFVLLHHKQTQLVWKELNACRTEYLHLRSDGDKNYCVR